MLYKGKINLANKKKLDIQVDEFSGGVNTLFSQTRLNKNEAVDATNLILIEDGIWDKRWGTAHYGGVTWTARPDGFTEYRKSDGTRELIVVADGKVWRVDPNAATKTEITGATFTQGIRVFFKQIANDLYIANGTDSLGIYNGTTLANFAGIAAPAWAGTPLARGAGLSSGSYTYYYQVTAVNEVGETTPAAEQSLAVDISRDEWNEADEYITVDWAAVSGATKYIVYFSDTSGYEVKLAEVTGATVWNDDGSNVPNDFIEPPTDNTTTAPNFSHMTISGNRIWGTGNPSYPWRVYFSGTGVNLGNFGTGYGGGWVDLERGGRATTTALFDYQGKVHVFCKTDDGRGTIWQINFETLTIGTESITVPVPTKIITAIGSNAARAISYVENDIFFLNPFGIFVLGNEPGILNVLRTNELTAKIRPYILGLDESSIPNACMHYYRSKVLVSVSQANGEPDRTIVYDRERAAWIKDWTVGVSQFGEFTDSTGSTHLLGIVSDRLVEFSESYEGDQGVAFSWKYISPRFPISKDWTEFGRIKKSYVRLRNVTGDINVEIRGTGKNQAFTTVNTATISLDTSGSGIGWDLVGDFLMGDSNGVPTAFAEDSLIRYLYVNKLIRDVQISISGNSLQDRAVILGYKIVGFMSKLQGPLSWGLSS